MKKFVDNPIPGKLYRFWSTYDNRIRKKDNGTSLGLIPDQVIVMFLEQEKAGSMVLKVVFKDLVGWIRGLLEEVEPTEYTDVH